jgi:phosphopantetheine binding protein
MKTNAERIWELLQQDWPGADVDETFAAIGMDSLDYLGFLADVEAAWDLTLPRAPGFQTPADVARWLAVDGLRAERR